jgi:hypothetical protein
LDDKTESRLDVGYKLITIIIANDMSIKGKHRWSKTSTQLHHRLITYCSDQQGAFSPILLPHPRATAKHLKTGHLGSQPVFFEHRSYCNRH